MGEQPFYPVEPLPQPSIPNEPPSHIILSDETANPFPNPLEAAILQATPEAEKTPSWFNQAVHKITDAWFDPKSFESPELYEKLGIRRFKKYMPISGDLVQRFVWKRLVPYTFAKHGDKGLLKQSEVFTRLFETSHLAIFGMATADIGMKIAQGNIQWAIAEGVLNTLVNVYPIMLQRYNRIRLYRAINRMEERQTQQEPLQKVSSM